MNCKPGDLAVLVRTPPNMTYALGRLFNVIEATNSGRFKNAFGVDGEVACWWCEAVGGPVRNYLGKQCQRVRIPDIALRPIRPGDISDEEVRELYAPKLPETA